MQTEDSIYTIGYEGATPDRLAKALKAAGIGVLIDVRATPLSRKPGFSKNVLAQGLQKEGIGYVGLRALGTPAEGREAARRGRMEEFRAIFAAHMQGEGAQEALAQAADIARGRRACLLCFEHAPHACHRLQVAQDMAQLTGQKIVHLSPAAADDDMPWLL